MSEPMVRLDPRHYQDLVDEARIRVGLRCPEWTDHNVSDPGMTLIDQFAWMTDILLYRVNRIPDRIHEALLNLLGIELHAPMAARADVRFTLAAPPTTPVVVSAGSQNPEPGARPRPAVEVATVPDGSDPAVVFQVTADAAIPVLQLTAAALWRAERPAGRELTMVGVVDGRARPGPDLPERFVFSTPPRPDDAMYLGFDQPIANVVLQLHLSVIPARGTSIDPDEVPLRWEVARADGTWEPQDDEDPVEVLSETTGGFNYDGVVELQVPSQSRRSIVGGLSKHWLRCRPEKVRFDSATGERAFTRSPDVMEVRANAIGVLVGVHHATNVEHEELGVSDGTAGQTFRVVHVPTLALGAGETLEVERRTYDRAEADRANATRGYLRGDDSSWEPWERRESLDESDRTDRHFTYDPARGEVRFGLAIKRRGYDDASREDAGWQQHGAIPPVGTRLRMSRYRHGGGESGNVEAGAVCVLRTPIPGVASVTNPRPAHGGLGLETLAEARLRAAEQRRLRQRAVTRRDFEVVAVNASEEVVRARCIPPSPGSTVQVLVLPRVDDPGGYIAPRQMRASRELCQAVVDRFEEWCLVGTSAHVTPVKIREVTVAVEVRCRVTAGHQSLEERVVRALNAYLNPYIGGSLDGDGRGWEWGRSLDVGELRTLVARVDGVAEVIRLRTYETSFAPSSEDGPRYREVAERLLLGTHELLASGRHEARATGGAR
jgi:predicted phage baseplate assembly protein